jgi:putative chitinase
MATFNLTADQLAKIFPANKQIAEWHKALSAILPRYNINTPTRIAAFLAQTGHESLDFTVLEENLNYRAAQLVKTWPKRFTPALAAQVVGDKRRIAEIAYGGRMGNNQPGDGYLFRGQGIIQLTGRDNFTRFGGTINRTAEQTLEYVQTKQGAVEAAAWFWITNNLNRWVDANDFDGLADAINIGKKTAKIGDAHGYADRKVRFERALAVLDGKTKEVVAPRVPTLPTPARPLRRGAKGDLVKQVQIALGIEADGEYGSDTEQAVKDWQVANGEMRITGALSRDQVVKLLG